MTTVYSKLEAVQAPMKVLMDDALARGMNDLAIIYGWSAIRLGQEVLDNQEVRTVLIRLTPTDAHASI